MQTEALWEIISDLCSAEGVSLFDVERSGTSGSGLLRVFITRGRDGGISHTECAGVSNRILNHPRVEEILPGSMLLEVSSPGVNRKLSRPDHFQGAVGERVKVAYRIPGEAKRTITGELARVENGSLEVCVEPEKKGASPEQVRVPLDAVQEARVDFLFR